MGRWRKSGQGRRDAAIVLALAGLAIAFVLATVASGRDGEGGRAGRGGEPDLPAGWHAIGRPLSSVTYPRQVFAAATYPIFFRRRPRSCWPTTALDQMPAGGVLLQIIEYAPTAPSGRPIRVPELPRRPARFHWSDAARGPFECAGPSFKFEYRQEDRALQAQVWTDPSAGPRLRAGALRILDRFR